MKIIEILWKINETKNIFWKTERLSLTLSYIMLQNGKTYFKNLAVYLAIFQHYA